MYTEMQEQALRDAPKPITFENAVEFAREFGKTPRSVISKVKSLELDYAPRVVAPKRVVLKSDLIAEIVAKLGAEEGAFNGLEKATTRALTNVVKAL